MLHKNLIIGYYYYIILFKDTFLQVPPATLGWFRQRYHRRMSSERKSRTWIIRRRMLSSPSRSHVTTLERTTSRM